MSTHEPASPPEPKTPLWLPAVGAVLFLLVGIWWATSTPASAAPADGAQADAADGGDAAPPPGNVKGNEK